MPQNWTLANDRVSATFDPADGARLTSLRIDDHELLVTEQDGRKDLEVGQELWWGAFVMAPWTSDLRDGTFPFLGTDVTVPADMGTAAVHGVARKEEWSVDGDTGSCHLGHGWPLGGRVQLAPSLLPDGISLHFTLVAEQTMPAALGWHPWFRSGARVELMGPARCQDRDDDGVPTGLWKSLPPAPWNDCLRHRGPVQITWPGVGTLVVEFDSDFATVFTAHEQGVCVEPVTSPAEQMIDILQPGEQIDLTITLTWRPV